jgi:hypothetical protein
MPGGRAPGRVRRQHEGVKTHLFNSAPRWSTPASVRAHGRAARAVFFPSREHECPAGGDQTSRSWELSTAVRTPRSLVAKGTSGRQ